MDGPCFLKMEKAVDELVTLNIGDVVLRMNSEGMDTFCLECFSITCV